MQRKQSLLLLLVMLTSALLVFVVNAAIRYRRKPAIFPASAMSLSNTTYRVPDVPVGDSVHCEMVTLRNSGTTVGELHAVLRGDPSFQLRPDLSCSATLPPGRSCSYGVSFAPKHAGSVGAVLYLKMSDPSGYIFRAVRITGSGVDRERHHSSDSG